MSKLQRISTLSAKHIDTLVSSIDIVLFDIDGVLVRNKTIIPGAVSAVAKFRELGKKIGFVTNNSIYTLEALSENLKPFGATRDEIITPNTSFIAYLKKINFKKDIYIIGGSFPKKILRKAGYNIIEYKDIQTTELDETISHVKDLALRTLDLCKNVGIVYVDLDFNAKYGDVQVAQIILNHLSDVQLLTAMSDDLVNIDENMRFVGARYYIDGIKRWTQKEDIMVGKPGQPYCDVTKSHFNIFDSTRALIIGDNVLTDIALGVRGGFQTLLVFSGVTKEMQAEDWKLGEESTFDYVASSLGEIYERLKNME